MPWDEPLIPNIDVPEHTPKDTGLLDRHGRPIKREPNPMGFHCPRKEKQ